MGIVVFDLEGVLIDNRKRYIQALKAVKSSAKDLNDLRGEEKKFFWSIFMDAELAKKLDSINAKALEIWKKLQERGYKLVILTGTRKEVALILLEKLKSEFERIGFKFKPDLVVWRPRGDKRKSFEFKKQKIREIELLLNDEIIEIHEDDPETIKVLREMGYKVVPWIELEPRGYHV